MAGVNHDFGFQIGDLALLSDPLQLLPKALVIAQLPIFDDQLLQFPQSVKTIGHASFQRLLSIFSKPLQERLVGVDVIAQ